MKENIPGIIDDILMKQVLADNNPQRISEVAATIEQSLIMEQKGMKPDAIVDTLEKSFTRKKQACRRLDPWLCNRRRVQPF